MNTTLSNANVAAQSTIVLKEFDSSEIEFSFNTEVDSYTSLENKVPPKLYPHHFLKYYGSFKKADKAFIMLEFADQGSLLDFFNGNQLPYERHEIHGLWSSLSNLFIGLEHIHSLDPDHKNSDLGTIRCVHQDLKPANIFVFRQGDSTTYRYQFKIGDFGMTSIALVKTTSKSTRIPADPSTKMYGAPELTNTHSALDTIEYGTLWEVDIWSMGCVLFEALVWMTCGSRGVSEFFQMRQKETDSDLRHESQGYSGCFHNGTARIRAVDDMMDLVMERRRNFDDLSEPIGDLILREMLIPSDKRRLEPRTLLPRFEKILEAEKRPPDHPETFEAHSWTPTTQRGSRSQDRTNHRGNKGSQAYDPARAYTTSPGTRRYDSPRPISTNIRASTSFTDSRNTFPPSIEARPMHAEPVSVIPIQSFDREHSRQSMILSDGPHLISQSPDNSKFLQDTSNPAVKDLEQTFAERSNHDHQHREGLTPSNDRPRLGNSSPSALAVASGSKVKGPEPYALVTISEVLKWIEKKKSGPAPEALRDQERAMREIKDREQVRCTRAWLPSFKLNFRQIFVVDDSDTMRDQHWDRVVDVLQALGYLVKSADPDGVELFLTSRPTEPKKSGGREITSLVRSLEDHRKTPHVGICNMENSLGPILEHVKSSLKSQKRPKILQRNRRGTNVYILTDAIWEGGADVKCGVEEPIKNLRKAMIDMSKTRATVSLQFIQFGDDPLGKERLRYLDDTLGKELNLWVELYQFRANSRHDADLALATSWITDTVKETAFGICSWEASAAISTKITMLKVKQPSPET